MNDADIEYLKHCMAAGLRLWYARNDDTWQHVVLIGNAKDEDEPVAFLAGGKGHFVALAAADRADFMITTKDLTSYPGA